MRAFTSTTIVILLIACGGVRTTPVAEPPHRDASARLPHATYLPRWRLPARVGGEGDTTFWIAGSLRAIDDRSATRLANDFTAERIVIAADLGDDGWVFVDERGGVFRAAHFADSLEPLFTLPDWEIPTPNDAGVSAQRNERVVNAFGGAWMLRDDRLSRLESAREVAFVDPSFGVALVDGGRLARTVDGGRTFEAIASERAVIGPPVAFEGSIIAPLSGATRTMPGIFLDGPFLVVTRDQAREVTRIDGLDSFPPTAPHLPRDARDRVTLAVVDAYPGLLDARGPEIGILDDQLIDLRARRVLRTLPSRLAFDTRPSGPRELATIEDDETGWVRIRAEEEERPVAHSSDRTAVFITEDGIAALPGICIVVLYTDGIPQVIVMDASQTCADVWTPIAVSPTHVVAYQAERGVYGGGLRRVARATGEVSEVCVQGEGFEALAHASMRPDGALFLRPAVRPGATTFAIGDPSSCLVVRTAPGHAESIDFASEDHGVAIVETGRPTPAIMWTHDGGRRWERLPDPSARGAPIDRGFGPVRCARDACRIGDGIEVRFDPRAPARAPIAQPSTPYTHREGRAALLPAFDCQPIGPSRPAPALRGSSFRVEGLAEGVIAEARGQTLRLTWDAGSRRVRATLALPSEREGCGPPSPLACDALLASEHGILLSCSWTNDAIDDPRCGPEHATFWATPRGTTTVPRVEGSAFAVAVGEGFALLDGDDAQRTGRIFVRGEALVIGPEVWSPNAALALRIDDRGVQLAMLSDQRTMVRDYRDAQAAFEIQPPVTQPATICESATEAAPRYVLRPDMPALSLRSVGAGSIPRQDVVLHLHGEGPSACIARLAMRSSEDAITLIAEGGALVGTYRTPYESRPIRCAPIDP